MKRRFFLLIMIAVLVAVSGCGVRSGEDTLKVGFIFQYDVKTAEGSALIKAAEAACEEKEVEMAQRVGISAPEAYYDAAAELIRSEGCDIIFADSYADEQALLKAAQEFPAVEICCAGGSLAHTAQLPNFHNAFARVYQGRYLAGVAAGMKLNALMQAGDLEAKEAKLGYIGKSRNAEGISGYTAFYLGAKSVCSDLKMDVQLVGEQQDEQKERAAALALIDRGCVVLGQQYDSDAAAKVCEEKGVFNVAFGGSDAAACPETFLVACRMDWTPYFKYIIGQTRSDAAIATDWMGDLENGMVSLSRLGTAAAEGTREQLAAVEKKLLNGELEVFDTEQFTADGKAVESFMADVDFDANGEGDTQVVSNGIFKESFYRSAPYFTIEADGIFLIGQSEN